MVLPERSRGSCSRQQCLQTLAVGSHLELCDISISRYWSEAASLHFQNAGSLLATQALVTVPAPDCQPQNCALKRVAAADSATTWCWQVKRVAQARI